MKIRWLLLLPFFFLFAAGMKANTLLVCANCALKTPEDGIKNASPHDTLLIKEGYYRSYNLIVDKPLTIVGLDYPVIDGGNRGEIMTILSDNVSVCGLRLINVGRSYTKDFAAIRVVSSSGFTIKDMHLEGLFFGIYLEKSEYGLVEGNTIQGDALEEFNSGNGIHLWHCRNVKVFNNFVNKVRDGIYLEFSDNILIKDNHSTNNVRYGLHFMFSNHDTYEGNYFGENGAGVAVMFSKDIRMTGNTFIKNWGTASFGLLLKEINDSEIRNNRFEENTTGISIEGSNRITYEKNDFISNGWALRVRGACYSNSFRGNNFLNNSFDLSYNSNLNDNRFEGNYWSDYAGYDLDRNGVGDVPYRPVKLFSYIVNRTPETIVLLRSLFMDMIDFSEKVSPVFTPDNLYDPQPLMNRVP
jgi:nitrous oxidase accessory protein